MKEYKRILIKLSGEAFESNTKTISRDVLENIFHQIKYLKEKYKLEISIVVGGGNIFRGNVSKEVGLGEDTAPADYMGMLATTINAIAIKTYFNNNGLKSEILNALSIEDIAKKATPDLSIKELKEGKVLIFGGGTGKPYVSTDTAAALRALETQSDVILMAKNGVDGAFDKDPNKFNDAKFLENLTFDEVIKNNLQVMDKEAAQMLHDSEKNINVIIFNMNKDNNIINLYENDKTLKTIITK